MPLRLWRVWVGMPTTGRRGRGLITRLRNSLGLSRRVAELDGAIPLPGRRPGREEGNDLGSNAVRRLGDDAVHDGAQITGLLVHRELPVGARAAAHDLEGVAHLTPTTELVHNVVHEPLEQLGDQLASGLLPALAEVYQVAVEPEAHRPPLVLLDQGRRVQP